MGYHVIHKCICFNYTHQSVITVFNTGLTSTSVGSFFTATTMESQRSSVLLSSTLATKSKSTSMKLSTPHKLSSTQTSTEPVKTLVRSFVPSNSTPTTTVTTKYSTTSDSSASLNSTPPPIQSTKCELVCLEALSSTLGELCQCLQYRERHCYGSVADVIF